MRPYGIAVEPPIVTFTVSATRVQAMGSFYFDGSGTYDPDGHIVTGQWNFGDGSLDAFPGITSGYYAYQQAGNYTLTLTITDNLGFTVNHSQTIVVVPYAPPSPPLPSIGPPKMIEHVEDFRIPVPDDWSVQLDTIVGNTKVDLVAIGPTYHDFRTNLIIFSGTRLDRPYDALAQKTKPFLVKYDTDAIIDVGDASRGPGGGHCVIVRGPGADRAGQDGQPAGEGLDREPVRVTQRRRDDLEPDATGRAHIEDLARAGGRLARVGEQHGYHVVAAQDRERRDHPEHEDVLGDGKIDARNRRQVD